MAEQRNTRQKEAVLQNLRTSDSFRSAQQIFTDLTLSGSNVGLTTVYRNLQRLAEAGEVDVIKNDEGEALYRICDTESHHHHIVCRNCGKTIDVSGPEFEEWVAKIAAQTGFSEVNHSVDLLGICQDCSKRH